MGSSAIQDPPDPVLPEPQRRRVDLADLDRRPPPPAPGDTARMLQQVDLTMMIGGFVLRTVVYGAIYAVACRWDFGQAMLTGLLAGDLVGSVATLGWDWRTRGAAAVVELVLVALFATWWWRASGEVAPRPEFQAVAVLAGFGAFTLRTGAQAMRQLGARDEQ